jgi:alpha-tubulin suppressor-like RCC1 family protein
MVYNPKTNFIDSGGIDLGTKLITKDYLISVYPDLLPQLGVTPQLWSWGSNTQGQLGVVGLAATNTPTQVNSGYTWKIVGSSNSHNLAIKKDGTLWTWGINSYGKLGINTTNTSLIQSTPIQVGIASNWLQISTYSDSSFAIKTDGTLWSWGRNTNGQLGISNNTDKISPTQVGISSNWRLVGAGNSHTLAIKTDGSLWGWGNNQSSALGITGYASTNSPRQIDLINFDWKSISCGDLYSIAIKADGTLWGWGLNNFYQLGRGNTATVGTPTQIGNLTSDWYKISTGKEHTIAIKTDGSLWAWGRNNFGQLGVGDNSTKTTPTKVGISSNWKNIECGNYYTMAIKTDGTIWGWGYNINGQLGIGNNTSQPSPVQIGANKNWKQISPGEGHSVGILSLDFI